MVMEVEVKWKQPIELNTRPSGNLTVDFKSPADANSVTSKHGVYVFAKTDGDHFTPLYIGESVNIQKRIRQHFKSHVVLMNKIKESGRGKKVLVIGEIIPKQGQQAKEACVLVQDALIKKAVDDESELFNQQGTKTPIHLVNLKGFRGAKNFFGSLIKVPKKKKVSKKKRKTK